MGECPADRVPMSVLSVWGSYFQTPGGVEGGNGHVEKNCPQRGAHGCPGRWLETQNPFPPTVAVNAFHIAGPLSVFEMGFQE